MSLISKIRSYVTLSRGVVGGLSEDQAGDDPIALFGAWFAAARRAGIYLPEAMTLATCGRDGIPSARMMLLKQFDERGFVFYTNYDSRKSGDLRDNPRAALVLHWSILQRQVRIEGTVERTTVDESTAYFRSRPRGSRIGAWASEQSAPVPSRAELDRRYAEYDRRYPGDDVPLPPFWGGYRLTPARIEFWQGRLNRLHDRICFTRTDGTWSKTRLYP